MNTGEHDSWNLYSWFQAYPVFIQIALVVIVLSILLFLLGNASLIIDRIRASYNTTRTDLASSIVTAELVGGLIAEDDYTESEFNKFVKRVKSLTAKGAFFKQVVIDQIIYYRRNFTDSTEQMLGRLFSKLGLFDNIVRKLKSSSWVQKVRGLREIQELKPKESVGQFIDPLLNDSNSALRIEAQATFLRLNQDDPFGFLKDATEELLPLHQIILFEIVANTPGLPMPDLASLLQSPNTSVVSFAIKLSGYYQQFEIIPQLIALLNHDSQAIRSEAIEVLGKLGAEESEATMIAKFPQEQQKVKLKILEAIGTMKTGMQADFLKKEFLSSGEFLVAKTAAIALAGYPGFDKESFLATAPGITPQLTNVINYSTNTLIRN